MLKLRVEGLQILGVIVLLFTVSFAHIGLAYAETWDLGYTNSKAEVEEIPSSINDANNNERDVNGDEAKANITEVAVSDQQDSLLNQEQPPVQSGFTLNKISTKENTFGVETVEKTGVRLYLSPVAGIASVMGNATVDVAPQYAFGARAGLLVSDSILVEGGYTYSLMNTSAPLSGMLSGTVPNNVLALKQNAMDAGVKLFFLGRDSRFRPFVGAGLGYTTSALSYAQTYTGGASSQYSTDFMIHQFQGAGQLGAEFAFTRNIVATAAFKLSGVITSSDSMSDANAATTYDVSRQIAGDSLSHSATYIGTIGLGVYF